MPENMFFAFSNGCYGYVVLGKISQSHSRNWALVGKQIQGSSSSHELTSKEN